MVAMALVNLGSLIGGGKGENEIALQIYNQAVELDSKSHIAYAARGRWKITFGDLNDALEDLNRAVELRGKNPLPANLIDRGVALLFQGKSDEAQQDFDKAVEIEPMLKGRINIQIEAAKKRRQQIR